MNIELTILNLKTNKVFTLSYNDIHKVKAFINKCKYSKKIKIIGQYGYETESQLRYANGY